jgi:hypothetical protein
MPTAEVQGVKFTDADVIDLDDFIPAGEYNPHNVHPWLLHDHGFALVVVFAGTLQDALDKAVDENKLDRYHVVDSNLGDYEDGEGLTYLGNASEPFDIESLGVIELPNPPRSFVAEFVAKFGAKVD